MLPLPHPFPTLLPPSSCCQVLVYFAVAKKGDAPTDGKTDVNPEGLTAAYGPHAAAVAARLHAAGLSCKVGWAGRAVELAGMRCCGARCRPAAFQARSCPWRIVVQLPVARCCAGCCLSMHTAPPLRPQVLDRPAFTCSMLEKLIWICAFMLVGARHGGCTVGEVESQVSCAVNNHWTGLLAGQRIHATHSCSVWQSEVAGELCCGPKA